MSCSIRTITEGSYDVSRFAVDAIAEIQRLNAQVDLFWNQELELYQRLGLKDGMSVLDCGCGTGYLLEKLQSIHPSLRCTGIEVDEQLVEVAATNASGKDRDRWQISQQSVTALDLPEDSFDFVICRLVLEHLPDPMVALHEVLRVLKTGGKAVFIDNDFDLHERTWPDSPALGELYDAYRRARRADNGNPCIGRELPCLLKSAGYTGVNLHLLAAHNQLVGDSAFLKAEGSGIPAQLVRTGHLAPSALDRIAGQWRAMLMAPGHAIFRMLFAAAGEKGVAASNGYHRVDTTAASPRESKSPAHSLRAAAAPAETRSLDDIARFIQSTLAGEMNLPADSIATDESLIRAGVDSMAAMALCSQLESRFAAKLSVADVLCDNSIRDLAAKVVFGREEE